MTSLLPGKFKAKTLYQATQLLKIKVYKLLSDLLQKFQALR